MFGYGHGYIPGGYIRSYLGCWDTPSCVSLFVLSLSCMYARHPHARKNGKLGKSGDLELQPPLLPRVCLRDEETLMMDTVFCLWGSPWSFEHDRGVQPEDVLWSLFL